MEFVRRGDGRVNEEVPEMNPQMLKGAEQREDPCAMETDVMDQHKKSQWCFVNTSIPAPTAWNAFQVLCTHEEETLDMMDEEYMLAAVTEEDDSNDGRSEVL